MSATIAPAPPLDDELDGRRKGRGRLVALLAVLAGVGLGAAWFLLLGPGSSPADAEVAGAEVVEGTVLELEPLTTTTGTAELHHARVALGLVLAEGVEESVITARAPLLQDALLREIATMDADHLRSAAGSDELRVNLTQHAQTIWSDGEVIRIVLTELLVQ